MPVALTVPKIKHVLSPIRIPVGAPFESSSVGTGTRSWSCSMRIRLSHFFINVSNKCSKTNGKGKLRIRRDVGWRAVRSLKWSFPLKSLMALFFNGASSGSEVQHPSDVERRNRGGGVFRRRTLRSRGRLREPRVSRNLCPL